ncbi:MAG TPA: SMC-Scp complex subunit ScpB [Saprospirales bacterium]|nr:SMC-Scp complex subunit ScpB [Saprospirales bacterium]HRQ28654.1 SMC-Scp complex subunit ScpB [Saprospiraceae bacterium]
MDQLERYIESLIFAADQAITEQEISDALFKLFESRLQVSDIQKAIARLMEKYATDDFAFELVEISNGFQFMTKGAYHHVVSEYLKQLSKKRLSGAALETLSIIAYKQPVTKPVIEQIRGVSSDYSIQKLLEKNLIEIQGRDDGPGKPLLYATSARFMDYFGLRSMKDLPILKDFKEVENQVGVEDSSLEEE